MRKLVLVVGLVLMASGAHAVTLNVIGGILHGASDVLVGGSLYDVQFLDGSCITLNNGCDDESDFTFQTLASATLASQALLDQVFLDGPSGDFDSSPNLTAGCAGVVTCSVGTRYVSNNVFVTIFSVNSFIADHDSLSFPLSDITFPGGEVGPCCPKVSGGVTFARWSAVPEPSTALLLSLGLTGLAAKGRRRNRS